MAEIIEPLEIVLQKAKTIAGWIKESKHFIAFTGAGISTSTGIPDFRGPQGVWTMREKGVTVARGSTLNKIPSPAHMSLLQLQRQGIMKYLVSQNTDGLHRRSGITPDNISELHGNSTRESCMKCEREYIRDFSTRGPSASDHRTGRQCLCGGMLKDTIINFGEDLPTTPLDKAFNHADMADLCLVLGSSLKVTPAALIPELASKKKNCRLVICNLQPTPLDDRAALVVHAKSDDLMQAICAELGIQIPPFVLERRLSVVTTSKDKNQVNVTLQGEDVDGTPASFLQAVKLDMPSYFNPQTTVLEKEPFSVDFETHPGKILEPSKATLQFMGWYNEPNLEINLNFSSPKKELKLLLLFQPSSGTWQVISHN